GIAGLREVLELLRAMTGNFWDVLYPEIEDGDLEYRASPLQWVGDRLAPQVKQSPLSKGKFDWFRYRESRTVITEQEAAESFERAEKRQAMIAEGKLPPETFDKDFDETPKAFYVALEEQFQATLESLVELSRLCDEKFGDAAPSFRSLQTSLE